MLIRLPNRDWLDLREVIGVHYMKADELCKLPPRVLIRLKVGIHMESFPDDESASRFRDSLGLQCNGAQVDGDS